jgi:glutathione S-transferase
MNTPNGQKVQIMLEELHEVYGTEWTTTLMYGFTILFPNA